MAAAYAANCRRVLLMGNRSQVVKRAGFSFRPEFASVSRPRPFSDVVDVVNRNNMRLILVDTLAHVRRFEAEGFTTKQAEAITQVLKKSQNDNFDNLVSMDKNMIKLESDLSKHGTEVKTTVAHHVSLLQQENEKLKTDIEKIQSEMRYEIERVIAGLRLDINLEKGRMRDEMNNQNQETTNLNSKVNEEIINLNSKIDREVHGFGARLDALKYELIKYCLGIIFSVPAVLLALMRIFSLM